MSVIDQEAAIEEVANGDDRGSVLLVGNPNVGKSVLFSNLTSHYVTVSNFPGTTVEVVRARARGVQSDLEIVDCPGVNDLSPRAEDARVTLQLLDETPDATVVQVADAKNLRRALLLTLQLADLDRPMVLVLNMADELEKRGGRIDQHRLQEILGIPVVSAVAVANRGTEELLAALENAAVPQLNGAGAAGLTDEYERNKALLSGQGSRVHAGGSGGGVLVRRPARSGDSGRPSRDRPLRAVAEPRCHPSRRYDNAVSPPPCE
jgi:small GTP-binding protein